LRVFNASSVSRKSSPLSPAEDISDQFKESLVERDGGVGGDKSCKVGISSNSLLKDLATGSSSSSSGWLKLLKKRFLGGKCDSGGDARGGGEGMKAAAAGAHSPSAGSAAGGATFGSDYAGGVGALPNAAGMRRNAPRAFSIGEEDTSGHSRNGDAPGAGIGGATNDPGVGGIHRRNGGDARGAASHTSFSTGIGKRAHTQLQCFYY